uniref:Pyridoxal phosphate (PLP)-dependent transferase superfamily protein n=1 Tax=Zea mays TaxID=4577 RepID=A0A804NZT8_MAIZE
MLVLINRYFRSRNSPAGGGDEMAPADRDHLCLPGCVPVRAKRAASTAAATVTTTARASRHNFVKAAASGLLAGAHFTNHESLPPLPDAYAEFVAAFPQYAHGALARADAIRGEEYQHLDRHVCLDYTGINLFSHAQMNSSLPSTSSAPPPSSAWQPPFFDIAYKSTSLRTQVQCGDAAAGGIGAAVTRRIMASLKIPEEEYAMVCTANRTTAFRLLAESYSFQPGKQLLPVYDYESEAVGAMADSARRRGAEVTSASFAWPSMRIHGTDLRKRLARGCRRGAGRGLFVFPLASRMTGARYPYLWMSAAHEQGWHVALDACALGTKDLDTFGLSLIRPDFIVCNFFKVFGENPSGFAGLFIKKSSLAALERSVIARSIGIVSIVPARRWSLHDGYSTELEHSRSFPKLADPALDDGDVETTSSFSGPLSSTAVTRSRTLQSDAAENGDADAPEIREVDITPENGFYTGEPRAENGHETEQLAKEEEDRQGGESVMEVECRGLDHADALGLIAIGNRLRCITNWLLVALQKLRHPHADNGHQLVKLYGPRVKFDRGPSLAFNVFDWKDKYEAERGTVLEHRIAGNSVSVGARGKKRKDAGGDVGILVVNASLGFLSNFEDAYRLWAFVAKFLDADFVEKERWRYTALNQKTVEV